ncbi:protoporphyrinogen oxidase-like [Mercenaria mercenaria]|uniref:protoporphyrinogen oxidase-like n=1 Tax=Mercenaria mercenaria TaxID=6596 RepID=UPI001E1DF39A|nr:protoporphyrinogen oxidase-like [Mercenaria mercenaria]
MSTAVIIGGGVSGLSSAYYLQKSSKFTKIIVLESANRVGGWIKTLNTDEGAKMEMGPRSIRPVGPQGLNTLYLAEELGLSDDIVPVLRSSPAAKSRFIYANDRPNIMPSSLFSMFKKTPPFSKPLVRYAFHDFTTPSQSKEDENVYEFISRRFDEDLAKYAIDPLCRGIFAGDCRKLSVKSCFPILHSAEEKHGSVIKGLAKAVSDKPPVQGRLSNLVVRRTNEKWSTFSFKQGLQQLSDSLRDAVKQNPKVEVLMNSPCTQVNFSNGKALLTVNGDSIESDHLISSVYAQDLANIVMENNSTLAHNLSKIPAVDAVVTCMEFDGKVELPAPGFGHLTPSFENSCVLGVIYDSCTFPEHDRQDKPSTRFTVMMGGSWIEDLKKLVPSMTTDDLGKFATKSLKTQLSISQEPIKIHTEIQRQCIPQYIVGHGKVLENIFSQIKREELPLSLVGSSYKGPSVNDCINNARIEMERITGTSLQ